MSLEYYKRYLILMNQSITMDNHELMRRCIICFTRNLYKFKCGDCEDAKISLDTIIDITDQHLVNKRMFTDTHIYYR